jgi:predicted RNA-binding Zn ribbon-like protein
VRSTVDLDLPGALELPLTTGEPWWYWLGGRSSVDFVNTLRERWRRQVETLVTPEDLSAWLHQAGLTPEPLKVPRVVLAEARELREAMNASVEAVVAGRPVPRAAVTLIDDWLVHAGGRPQLLLAADGAPLLSDRAASDSARRALGTLALDAATMLGTPGQRARVRICGADDCSARFYDRSPAGRRRWCSMQTCGNAAKARRHRARQRDVA